MSLAQTSRVKGQTSLRFGQTSLSSLAQGGGVQPPWGVVQATSWGDSLTAGTGSSSGANQYPAKLSVLRSSTVLNRGIGGQTSTQIAARQGGVPINVTVSNNLIPAASAPSAYSMDFASTVQGWTQYGFGGTTVAVSGGKLVVTAGSNAICGAQFVLPDAIAIGDTVRLQATVADLAGGATYVQGMIRDSGGVSASGGNALGARTVDETYVATRATAVNLTSVCLLFMPSTVLAGKQFTVDNVTITVTKAATGVSITAKDVNILYQSGNFTGSSIGVIDGVHGTMTTDASGNWTFTRDQAGSDQSVANPVRFVPDGAAAAKDDSQLLWAGRNNYGSPVTVKSDIAAMVAYLAHTRYLVGSVLTSAADNPAGVTAIQTLNADLKAIYGERFVDVYAALRAAGDGSANDNADITAGFIPRSLRTDDVHLNDAGYAIVAQTFYGKLSQFGA